MALLFGSTASAQSPSTGLILQTLTITQSSESASTITYNAQVTIANSSNSDFSGVQRVDYQIDGANKQLAYIITALRAGQTLSFTFTFELTPGEHTIRLEVGESARVSAITVAGADIDVEIIDYRFMRGRTVEFDLQISNSGDLIAEDLALTSAWQGSDGEVASEQIYLDDIPDLGPDEHTTAIVPIRLAPGSYQFSFSAITTTIEGDLDNNSAEESLDVEFIDLRTNVVVTENLGWDGDGNAFISVTVEVTNAGVDDTSTFYIGIECDDETESNCSTAGQSDKIPAGESSHTEMRLWLPIGETSTRIFAAENENTFQWGNLNAIDHIFEVPDAPEHVWTLNRITTPEVASYWSDGSANVDLDLTFVNNGTNESQVVVIECSQNEVTVEDCGTEFTVEKETDVYPTVINQTLRLPNGETNLAIRYGASGPKSTSATVPERIVGVDRDVWDCFSDTSNVYPGYEENEEDDSFQGIGCAGWRRDHVIKWPFGEAIQLWSHGDDLFLEILDEVLNDVGSLLNIEFETVETKDEAQLTVHTGIAREDADLTDLEDCIDFGGCADTRFDEKGQITSSNIAIWLIDIEDEKRLEQYIRSATLHELLHALTYIGHRHHDRTSVMSYEALNYTTVDGVDLGLFNLIGNPLVKPGMTFDEVLGLIIFADELNDPPEPIDLSAQALLRRAHAALMDAGSFSFRVNGDWLGCRGNHDFGPAQFRFANLKPHSALWHHFEDGNDRYYHIGNPSDWVASEWWLRRGLSWQDVGVDRVSEATTFRAGLSSVLRILYYINVYADPSDYSVTSRNSNNVLVQVSIDQPNPRWSRDLDLQIKISINPDNYRISKYELHWNFDPRNRNNCDQYYVRASSPVYGVDFTFPDAVRETSKLLIQPETSDETALETEVATNRDTDHIEPSLPQIGRD